MKVVHLLPALEQGGVESVVTALNRMLVGRGQESVVVSRGGRLVETIEADGGRHIALDLKSKNPLTYFFRMFRLRRLLRAEKPDLVCVHSRVPAWLFVGANRSLKLKWISYAHGANSVSAYSAVMTRGDRVVVPSRYLADYLRANYPIDESRLKIVANPVSGDRFDPARVDAEAVRRKREGWGVSGEAQVILSVGRITPLKGFDTLIEAFAAVRTKLPRARLVIVGGADRDKGAYLEALRRLAQNLGVAEAVTFAGQDSEVPVCLAAADVIVSANVRKPETFGLSIVEALLMNRPVIAKAFGGAKEIIEDGESGLLVNEASEFAGAIARALDGSWAPANDLRARMLRRFNAERFAEDTLKVYRF